MEIDKRELSRINIKFGKFFDPFLILAILFILTTSILAVNNLSPRTFSKEQMANVLGIQEDSEINFTLIRGNHNYITSENLEERGKNHFKYTTLVTKPPEGRVSKPIIQIDGLYEEKELKILLNYTNLNNAKISIFDESQDTSYILQKDSQNYSQNININQNTNNLYLVIENVRPVFFNQYIEINFFLNP